MTDSTTPAAPGGASASANGAETPTQIVVALCDLGIAPENIRAKEPADADIPQLAETIAVADVLVPLCVRPGRKGEQPFMALDGRRRKFGLDLLLENGRIDAAQTAFESTADLARAMRRASVAHGEHEKRIGAADPDWPDWYAAYMAAERAGAELPT